MLYQPGFANQIGGVLASIGTPAAQRALVDYASQAGLPFEDRRAAADSFAKSVTRTGVLLTSSEVKRQYDRYNASENDARNIQILLGDILDMIESNSELASSNN